jgi:uncharacterized protein (DUF1501 family)
MAIPTFLMNAAAGDPLTPAGPGAAPVRSGKVLVVIEMQGGNDGLNTAVPYTDPGYAKARPVIGIAENDLVKISPSVGLHPSLKSLGDLYNQGKVAVMTGVGYPNPNRSHFHSMDIWQTGNPQVDISNRTGWLARYFDADGHLKSDPLSGVTVGSALPLALTAEDTPISVIGSLRSFGFQSAPGVDKQKTMDALQALYAQGTVAASPAEFVRNVGVNAYTSVKELKAAIKDYDARSANAAKYPIQNGLASGLQTVSKLVTGGLETKVFYLTIGGFDTHANQPNQHAQLLQQMSDALAAFYQDLAQQGRANDVTVMTFSEFGRRVHENGSAGTDHGAASVMFVLGGAVKGGVYGDYPSLEDLDDGDLRFHTDYRSVYATLLEKWLGVPSSSVLGSTFPTLNFV